MRFSRDDIQRFAAWSGDHNPLHVDETAARRSFFGQPVVHGMLTAIRVLTSPDAAAVAGVKRVDVEFRSAVFADAEYAIEASAAASGLGLAVRSGDTPAMIVHVNADRAADPEPDAPWIAAARANRAQLPVIRHQPADSSPETLQRGVEVIGSYTTAAPHPDYLAHGRLHPVQARVLGLCSYVIGMEIPGLRSLFTRLSLTFADVLPDSPELLYRARTIRFDEQFRILDVKLDVAAPNGVVIATGDLRSYVRFTPVAIDPAELASYLQDDGERLAGKVVLVCGGTRGLGAQITAALAAAGCRVFASYHRDAAAARELDETLAGAGLHVELVEGDAADPAWCQSTLETIIARHGRLEAVVLNACAPPAALRLGPDSARAFTDYISANLPLAQVPVATCLPALAESRGAIVCVSSSFVADPPAGFGHYVALKEAVESTVRAAVRESRGVRALIARPPRLQTTWNDTPTGVLGTVPASHAAAHIVNRLAGSRDGEPIDILSDFPRLQRRAVAEPPPADPDFTIGLVASFTAEPLLDGLRFWFRELGVRGDVEVAPYGQILQTLLAPAGGLTRRPGIHVVMLRVRDWLRELAPEQARTPGDLRAYLGATAHDLERAMRTHRAHTSAETLLVLCPSAADAPADEDAAIEATETDLAARLSGLPGLTVIRAREFHARYQVEDAAIGDALREHIAHIPYQPAYFHTLSTIVMRHAHRKLAPARKVVVVDCDNTLWKGVVGEVGPEGLTFDAGHRALHAALTRLSASGVLVALCSKNEESDVWRVFETRPDLGISRDRIVTAAINWQPKSANLAAIAARLNLGLDSFVFVDDNPVECAEVRASCPEVLTLEWPQDPARAMRLLEHTWELDPRSATAEDQRRTELYQEEFRRQELQSQALTFRDFIASLDLAVDIFPLNADDVKRASQLTLRTNQFNFTTRRRDEAELQALADAGTHAVRTVRVRDRFGDYGLVGLLIAESRADELFADTFLLSCRVLGRGVEHRMAAELGRLAVERGAATVRLRVEPTKRNTPARAFLDALVPAELRREEHGVVEAALPAAFAAALAFEPPDQAGPAIQEDDRSRKGAAPADATRLRSREEQIGRTAFELSTVAGLARAIDGEAVGQPAAAVGAAAGTEFVFDAFASALGLSAARVRELDSLEALACDSFKIVEITVSLLEKFPWLPATLLFEHRSVAEIAARIADMAAAGPTAAPAVGASAAPDSTHGAAGDIAVVGMHLRSAGAGSTAELWQLLSAGRVAVTPVPVDRKYFFGRLDDSRQHFAGLLDRVDRFDAELFGITPREAELMDPQLRLFLEVAWGALEDAGCLGAELEPETGVFAGVMYGDYGYRANLVARAADNPFKCWEGFSLANRLSQVFGFRGPSIAVDTACSSSGTAVHLACRALGAGDCKVAIAGGVNLILDPDRFVQLGRLGILSSSGRCLAFGAEADGTVLGEGAGVVVLRPLADAIARGDRIYGVIKATGVSTGSGTVGFTAPNPQAQAHAIRRTVRAAGIDPRTITYVETHGTGTALGDPIEVRGLTLAYGDPALWDPAVQGTQACALGSIKPNVGHLEAGAGVLGLIKLLLQMQRATLLPSITSDAPNPQIPFADGPFSIQRSLAAWTRPVLDVGGVATPQPRRGALNSFGVGGANAHVIVEEAPPVEAGSRDVERSHHILTVSARTQDSLQARLGDLARLLEGDRDVDLADVCYSANTGSRHLGRRAVLTARTREEMAGALKGAAAGQEVPGSSQGALARTAPRARIAFLFTGQGSQYAGMGRELYDTQPVFRQALDRCFELFEPRLETNLKASMFAAEGTDEAARLNQTACTQPALFSLGYALAELWRSWGIRPDAVMGHSIGEITAMCVAGGLSLEDAVTLVAARGRLMQALPAGGAMTSVMAPEPRVAQAIAGCADRVAIAAVNGPQQVVVSGDAEAVAQVAATLAAQGIKNRPLVVSHAFHSPLMRPMLAEYAAVVRTVRLARPSVPFVSCVLGRVADAELAAPDYWVRNVIDPVRFTDAMRAIDALGLTGYAEMGPHPVLLGMGRQCIAETEADRLWLPSLRKDGKAWPALLSSVSALYLAGADIDWRGFDAPYPRRRVTLPPYPFAGKSYWIEAAVESSVVAPARTAAAEDAANPGIYEIAWRLQPAAIPAHRANGQWLIFADSLGVGDALARAIQKQGGRSIMIAPDDAAADLSAGVRALDGRAAGLRGIVYLRELGGSADADHSSAATAAVERAASLMRELARFQGPNGPLLWMVTRNAVASGADTAPVAAAQAALWGLGRTFALEHPARWGGLIDLPGELRVDSVADLLLDELLSDTGEDQVAVSTDGRRVPRLTPRPAAEAPPVTISAEGTYLVTGGLGALGLHTARWLVAKGARHLVLTGRRGLDSEGALAIVRELGGAGATVAVVAADVSSPTGVDTVFDAVATAPPLRGVFHAAGVDEIRPLAQTAAGDAERVMAAKVRGAWLLHDRTRRLPLDLFVCFSSMASVLGSPGRAIYGAANAFLDALVHERRRLALPAASVNWGPWRGGGMASAEALEQYRAVGNRGLDPAAAIRALDALLGAGAVQALVADIDWAAFRSVYEARRPRPLIAETGLTPAKAAAPALSGRAPWVEQLAAVPVERRAAELAALLRSEVAQTLGFEGAADVSPDQPFHDMGMDSLMSADFAQRLHKRLGVRGTALVFDHPTVTALAAQLVSMLDIADHPVPGAVEASVAAPALASVGAGGAPLPPLPSLPSLSTSFPSESELYPVLPRGTERYREGLDAEIFDFQRRAWPSRDPALIPARWKWMFVESARRLRTRPQAWLHREGGVIVGHNGAIAVRVQIGRVERPTAWLVDTMVLEEFRSQAVGARLMMEAHEDLPFALSLGQTEQMRAIQLRLGWEQVVPLQTAQLLVRPERVLTGKLPGPAALAAGFGLRAASAVRDVWKQTPRGTVRAISRFESRHDAVWAAMSRHVTCAVRRDASYLNWKYVDQPGQDFIRLELADDRGVRAIIVCMIREADRAYKYRRGFIVDVVAPLGDAQILNDILQVGIEALTERGVDAVWCLHANPQLTAALRQHGFRFREPSRFLLVRPGAIQGQLRADLLRADGWFVSHGDSDIDRPSQS